jgi:hypothetical protein
MAVQLRDKFECLSCGGVYFDTLPDGCPYHHACPPLGPDKDGVVFEHDDKRDENLADDRYGRTIGIRRAGAGVKCLTNPQLTEPTWISRLRKRVAKEEEALNA